MFCSLVLTAARGSVQETRDGELVILHDLQSVLHASELHEVNMEAAAQLRSAVPDLHRAQVKVRGSSSLQTLERSQSTLYGRVNPSLGAVPISMLQDLQKISRDVFSRPGPALKRGCHLCACNLDIPAPGMQDSQDCHG